jgi:hypothetical protein
MSIVPVFISLSDSGLQISYGQDEQQNFTAPEFGISMQYPARWTFVPAEDKEKEEQDYATGQGASVGTFCPTASLDSILGGPDCGMDVPIRLALTVYKLEEGTTSKEFYDFKILPFLEKASNLLGFDRKIIETKNINISGLAALQIVETRSNSAEENKHINVFVVNGSKGYNIEVLVGRGYDTYVPTIQKMIDSFKIE